MGWWSLQRLPMTGESQPNFTSLATALFYQVSDTSANVRTGV
jgi:hypothetical protein